MLGWSTTAVSPKIPTHDTLSGITALDLGWDALGESEGRNKGQLPVWVLCREKGQF